MACYATLLSLSHILNNIKIHPRPPISLDQNQVESLTRNLTFFQNLLECRHSYEEDEDLESRIANAAYAAEDVIETHILDQIHAGSHISTVNLRQGLERVIQDMDLIKNEVMQIKTHWAALLSLSHILNNINIHPRPPISLDQQQLQSLTQNLTFFQHFLESYPTYEDEELERRIANAAHAAEDVIETHIVDQIRATATSHDHGENVGCLDFCKAVWRVMNLINKNVKKIIGAHSGEDTSSVDLYADLERVIQDMDLIKKEVMQMIQHKIITPQHHPHLHTNSSSGDPAAAASTWQSSITPVFDEAMINKVLNKLTGQQSSLQIIPIVGMGGIGKTTFARSIYSHSSVVKHFEVRAWVTISQEYSRRNILQVLYQEVKGSTGGLSGMSEGEIGLKLYQHLWGRRYLIAMDDIWSVEAWYKVKSFFPDNNNGSRIMMTTRLSNLAFQLSGCHVVEMQFLDVDKSWDLLCKIVFGKQDCPIELENVGKEIARKCGGLPLSIVVIGGLLKKSNMTRAYWIHTIENLNLLINSVDDERALRILRTSYKELPMHLKPCFLYMGVLPEDGKIEMSVLIKLWVSEGFLKPKDGKSLEEVGEDYLKELIERNLILIHELRRNGEAKICKIHDLLRDVCLREAKRQKFLCVVRRQKHHTPQGIDMERRICIDQENTNEEYSPEFLHAMGSASFTRSMLYTFGGKKADLSSLRFRLLRVYSPVGIRNSIATYIPEQANLRYLSLRVCWQDAAPRLASLCSHLWNLQTLTVWAENSYSTKPRIAPSEIWEMPLLRHVMLQEFVLPDPPNGEHNFVLENLQTLSGIIDFKFSDEVVKRIPNIKKLKLVYKSAALDFCLNNLGRLQKMESLSLKVSFGDYRDAERIRRNLVSFPHSLKKLTLYGTRLNWEDLTERIGNLPLLQVLKLNTNACVGRRWETIEGQFCSLRVLQILDCGDLILWYTDDSHFPRLEYLSVKLMKSLVHIPLSIGAIPTLKKIWLVRCSMYAAHSARRIMEEQDEYGNKDLQVVIDCCWYHEYKEYLEDAENKYNASFLSASQFFLSGSSRNPYGNRNSHHRHQLSTIFPTSKNIFPSRTTTRKLHHCRW